MVDTDTRGILTEADKEWLKGEKEYNQRQTEAKRRQQIRDRVTLAMQDFELLAQEWSPQEMKKVMDEVDGEERGAEMIELLYIMLNEHAIDEEHVANDPTPARALAFRRSLAKGIREGKGHFGDDPGPVLLASNTRLFEAPDLDTIMSGLDTDQWRDSNTNYRLSVDGDEDDVIDKSDAAEHYRGELINDVFHQISDRHTRVGEDIETFDRVR